MHIFDYGFLDDGFLPDVSPTTVEAGLGRKRTEYAENESCDRRSFCCHDKPGSRRRSG